MVARIFLCHASDDKAHVREVYYRLRAIEGFEPWLDEEELLPGQIWEREIPRALQTSDFILIFLSRTSVAKRGYVQREMKMALDVWEELPEGTIHTIPVRLDDCDVPEQFRRYQWANLFEPSGFDRIVRAIRTELSKRPVTNLTPILEQPPKTSPPEAPATKDTVFETSFTNSIDEVIIPFSLAPNFGERVNQLGIHITTFESTPDSATQDQALREALVIACDILQDINLPQLQRRIEEVFASANTSERMWFLGIIGTETMQGHFSYFLNNVESAVLAGARIDSRTRERILRELRTLRERVVSMRAQVTPLAIRHAIRDLQQDVCLAKEEAITDGNRRTLRRAVSSTLVHVVPILVNIGNEIYGFYEPMTVAGAAASVLTGATGLFSRDRG